MFIARDDRFLYRTGGDGPKLHFVFSLSHAALLSFAGTRYLPHFLEQLRD